MAEAVIPVILCGGSGTRLWPASREHRPKQFLPLIDKQSLLQNTMLRAARVSGARAGDVVTVTHEALAPQVRSQLMAVSPSAAQHILREPLSRNTAAAVAYAAVYINRIFGEDSLMWILPSDHHVGDEAAMTAAFQDALAIARKGFLATFGIRPSRPETGYGYIRQGKPISGDAVYAEAFVEKPDAITAANYIASGNYLWNSGMFLFRTETILNEYKSLAPDILNRVQQSVDSARHPTEVDRHYYASVLETPFDRAIMEKSSRVAVVPCNPAWSDVGSWESLWEIGRKDASNNVIAGNAVCHDTRGCLIQAQNRLITCAGLENMVVVDTGDAVLIANRSDGDALRSLVRTLKKEGYTEVTGQAVSGHPNVVSVAA